MATVENQSLDPGGDSIVNVENSLLGITNWWFNKHTRAEVLVLVTRHFKPDEILKANQILATACNLQAPVQHKNSPLRSAGEANAVDLIDNLGTLVEGNRIPRFLIPSDELGILPLGALAIRDEVSVSARLEYLEESLKKVCSVLEKVQSSPPPAISRLEALEENLRKAIASAQPQQPSFAAVASGHTPAIMLTPAPPDTPAVHDQEPPSQNRRGSTDTNLSVRNRPRSRSESLKRKAEDSQGEDDGFRKQGRQRQRKSAVGTSQVEVDNVGEYIAPAEFYIGNTDKRTNEDTIIKVLKRCAAAVEGGDNLVIEKVELLTKEKEPRTKCWKVIVPYRFKSMMEKDEVYPSGWRHRKFFGSRNFKDKNKKPRLDETDSVEKQVLAEQEIEANLTTQQEQRAALQLRLEQLESRMKNSAAAVCVNSS